MKDPLLKYIQENRSNLDTHTPNDKNWESIQNRMNQPRKMTKIVFYVASFAALIVIGLFMLNQSNESTQNHFAENINSIQSENSSDSTTIRRTEDINWQASPLYVYDGNREKRSAVSDVLADGDETYLYSFDNLNSFNFTASASQGSVQNFEDVTGNMFYRKPETFLVTSNDGRTRRTEGTFNYSESQPPVYYDVDRYYEAYEPFNENEFETPLNQPLSTFGIDVDGAGYSNMRRFIQAGYLPPKDAVKLEEMVNYFNYDLPEPEGEHPFSITTEVGECPWQTDHLLMQVALKGKSVDMDKQQANNLVFLLDVSGSMNAPDKLPLLKKSLYLLVNEMGSDDRVAIVVYAGAAGLVLPPTSGKNKSKIYDAIERLDAGGSTAGGEGINLAYEVAKEASIPGGNNRIILATDGDFNVGVSNDDELIRLIEEKRKSGIFLSVLGFGTGNLQNAKMEKLADNGNGNYNYIDNILEAKKVLVDEMGGTLITIAKDVKLQLEFNPEHVKNYRLLGYENRILAPEDFENDAKDAGDLGSGHTVIALYEITPVDAFKVQKANGLRYQKQVVNTSTGLKNELAIIKFRYKKPNGNTSRLIENIVENHVGTEPSENFNFASAVAEFGMLIRDSKYKGMASFDAILKRAKANKGKDEFGYRAEFIQLVERAILLKKEYDLLHLN